MQKNIAKLPLLAAAVAALTGCLGPSLPPQDGKISVKILVDGRDVVYIQGKNIWVQHQAYELPGKWAGQDLPVTINETQEWRLAWNSNITEQGVIDAKDGIPASGVWSKDNFSVDFSSTGWGECKVLQYPNKDNDYTFAVSLDDTEPNGAHWHKVDIDWTVAGAQ